MYETASHVFVARFFLSMNNHIWRDRQVIGLYTGKTSCQDCIPHFCLSLGKTQKETCEQN